MLAIDVIEGPSCHEIVAMNCITFIFFKTFEEMSTDSRKLKRYNVLVACNGIFIAPSLVEISQLIHKLDTQRSDL
jgi:hypothetical protein